MGKTQQRDSNIPKGQKDYTGDFTIKHPTRGEGCDSLCQETFMVHPLYRKRERKNYKQSSSPMAGRKNVV